MRKGTLGGELATKGHKRVFTFHSVKRSSQHDETHSSAIFERNEEFAGLAAGWV